jgi:hypothetical protein
MFSKIGEEMDKNTEQKFREQMSAFMSRSNAKAGDVALSIKLKNPSGCFQREHSPDAYALIDPYLKNLPPNVEFLVHESGPELLIIAAATTLAANVIGLITAIIKAREEGEKKGDRSAQPLELIVRRAEDGHKLREETVLRIGHAGQPGEKTIEEQVEKAIVKFLKK